MKTGGVSEALPVRADGGTSAVASVSDGTAVPGDDVSAAAPASVPAASSEGVPAGSASAQQPAAQTGKASGYSVNGTPLDQFRIVYPTTAAETALRPSVKNVDDMALGKAAAVKLQEMIEQATGVKLPVEARDDAANADKTIRLAFNAAMQEDAFAVTVSGSSIRIDGGLSHGIWYGVYDLLEEGFGYRFFTKDVIVSDPAFITPGFAAVDRAAGVVNLLNRVWSEDSPFLYRSIHGYDFGSLGGVNGTDEEHRFFIPEYNYDGIYANIATRQNGKDDDKFCYAYPVWGNGRGTTMAHAHAFESLLSGTGLKGEKSDEQPCLTDPATYNKVLEQVLWLIQWETDWDADPTGDKRGFPLEHTPGENLFQISLGWNDNTNYCQCANCQAKIRELGSLTDVYIDYVNRIAAEVKARYGDSVHLLALAYFDTAEPPVRVVPADNVDVLFCFFGIGCNNHSLLDVMQDPNCCAGLSSYADGHTDRSDSLRMLRRWLSLTRNVYIWEYLDSFTYFLGQGPTYSYIYEEFRALASLGVKGIYAETSVDYPDGVAARYIFEDLRDYLTGRLMWQPNMSAAEYEKLTKEFLAYVYCGTTDIQADAVQKLYNYLLAWDRGGTDQNPNCWMSIYTGIKEANNLAYYAKNGDAMQALLDSALAQVSDKAARTSIQYLQVNNRFLTLSGQYYDRYVTGDDASKAAFVSDYAKLYALACDVLPTAYLNGSGAKLLGYANKDITKQDTIFTTQSGVTLNYCPLAWYGAYDGFHDLVPWYSPATGVTGSVSTGNAGLSGTDVGTGGGSAVTPPAEEKPGTEEPLTGYNINGTPLDQFRIVHPTTAAETALRPSVKHVDDMALAKAAAVKLQGMIEQATGVKLPVEAQDNVTDTDKTILLAFSPVLSEDAFTVTVSGTSVRIDGGLSHGIWYGVYDLLEEGFGYRFFTKTDIVNDLNYINASFANVDKASGAVNLQDRVWSESSPFLYRSLSGYGYRDLGGVNGTDEEHRFFIPEYNYDGIYANIATRQNGKDDDKFCYAYPVWGNSRGTTMVHAHAFNYYLAGTGLKGEQGSEQPCLTDQTTYDKILEQVLWLIQWETDWDADPTGSKRGFPLEHTLGENLFQISLGWNDNMNYCTCSNCQAKIEELGSLTDVYIDYVNRIAAEVKAKYGDSVHLMALPYNVTMEPPVNVKPADNVDVMYCINACQNHTLLDAMQDPNCCTAGAAYYSNVDVSQAGNLRKLRGWLSQTENVYVWEYLDSFAYYIGQGSVYSYTVENFKALAQLGVKGIYAETSVSYPGGAEAPRYTFEDLRDYMICRLMWQPNMSAAELEKTTKECIAYLYCGTTDIENDAVQKVYEYLLAWDKGSSGEGKNCWMNNYSSPKAENDLEYYAKNGDAMEALLDSALAQVSDEKGRARIRQLQVNNQFLTLSGQYYERYVNGDENAKAAYISDYNAFYDLALSALPTSWLGYYTSWIYGYDDPNSKEKDMIYTTGDGVNIDYCPLAWYDRNDGFYDLDPRYYHVSFRLDEETEEVYADQRIMNFYATSYGMPKETPSRPGYEFDGWYYYDESGEKQTFKFDFGGGTKVTGKIAPSGVLKVYASWLPDARTVQSVAGSAVAQPGVDAEQNGAPEGGPANGEDLAQPGLDNALDGNAADTPAGGENGQPEQEGAPGENDGPSGEDMNSDENETDGPADEQSDGQMDAAQGPEETGTDEASEGGPEE